MRIINDIIVEGITNDFVTLDETYTGQFKEDGGSWFTDVYELRAKNSKNQTIIVTFECFYWDCINNKRWWNVILNINSKRNKGFQQLKQTGKAGIESLIIAKRVMRHFIDNFYKYVEGGWYNIDDRVFVWGDDRHRYNVYKRYLQDLGFVEGYVNVKDWKSGKCLMKDINKTICSI